MHQRMFRLSKHIVNILLLRNDIISCQFCSFKTVKLVTRMASCMCVICSIMISILSKKNFRIISNYSRNYVLNTNRPR